MRLPGRCVAGWWEGVVLCPRGVLVYNVRTMVRCRMRMKKKTTENAFRSEVRTCG
jgi:hypothetical protein